MGTVVPCCETQLPTECRGWGVARVRVWKVRVAAALHRSCGLHGSTRHAMAFSPYPSMGATARVKTQRYSRELQALATQLHQNVEIRDRTYHLKNYKSCFVGQVSRCRKYGARPTLAPASGWRRIPVPCGAWLGVDTACGAGWRCHRAQDAVTWMVASGWAVSRNDAVRKGRRLVRARYIHHVVNNHDFEDDALFYRFYADETKRWVEPRQRCERCRGTCPDLAFAFAWRHACRYSYRFWAEQTPEEAAADPRKWRFEPHTVTNSLILNVPLATQLETAVVEAPEAVVRAVFRTVRQRVLDISAAADVWVQSKSLSGGGVKVRATRRPLFRA